MGINVDRVISATFAIGGARRALRPSYGLYVNSAGYQMGFQTGLFAFTAACSAGSATSRCGSRRHPIGLIEKLGTGYVGDHGASR